MKKLINFFILFLVLNVISLYAQSSIPRADFAQPEGDVLDLVLSTDGSTLFVAGAFTLITNPDATTVTRNHICAINTSTGYVTSWDPNANDVVYSIALYGSILYAGGDFTNIGGQTRNYIAALNVNTGSATSWNPNSNGSVGTVEVSPSGTIVYAASDAFSNIGGAARTWMATLDATTGLALWDPACDFQVYGILPYNSSVYITGAFDNIGGQARDNIAQLNSTTGLATGWNPNASNYVNSVSISGSTIYAGGAFSTIGGESRYCLAALDASTGLATSWVSVTDNVVASTLPIGQTLYVGGVFGSLGGQPRSCIGSVNASTGLATAWDPVADNVIIPMVSDGTNLYIGGFFTTIGGESRRHLAAFNIAENHIPVLPDWGIIVLISLLALSGTVFAFKKLV